jgi:alpha-glucosidase
VLAYRRTLDDDRRVVVVNFTSDAHAVDIDGEWTVEVASDGAGEGEPYRGRVAGDQALVLRPRS